MKVTIPPYLSEKAVKRSLEPASYGQSFLAVLYTCTYILLLRQSTVIKFGCHFFLLYNLIIELLSPKRSRKAKVFIW